MNHKPRQLAAESITFAKEFTLAGSALSPSGLLSSDRIKMAEEEHSPRTMKKNISSSAMDIDYVDFQNPKTKRITPPQYSMTTMKSRRRDDNLASFYGLK